MFIGKAIICFERYLLLTEIHFLILNYVEMNILNIVLSTHLDYLQLKMEAECYSRSNLNFSHEIRHFKLVSSPMKKSYQWITLKKYSLFYCCSLLQLIHIIVTISLKNIRLYHHLLFLIDWNIKVVKSMIIIQTLSFLDIHNYTSSVNLADLIVTIPLSSLLSLINCLMLSVLLSLKIRKFLCIHDGIQYILAFHRSSIFLDIITGDESRNSSVLKCYHYECYSHQIFVRASALDFPNFYSMNVYIFIIF